jgi:hypothetical protein
MLAKSIRSSNPQVKERLPIQGANNLRQLLLPIVVRTKELAQAERGVAHALMALPHASPGRGQIGVRTPKTSSSLVEAVFPVIAVNASTKATAPVWL